MKLFSHLFLWVMHHWYQRRSQYNYTGRVALCCIAKMESDYIREYVEYYKALGFDCIFIYDNNEIGGERFEDVIGDYIAAGFCQIIDYRGRKMCQTQAYQDCYVKHRKEYDWFAFFDCDEFLTFADGTKDVHDFLNRKEFLPFQLIHINWMVYGDNEMLDNDGRGVLERFTQPIQPFDYRCKNIVINNHVKTIIRGGLSNINWVKSYGASHTPLTRYYACCSAIGNTVEANAPFSKFDFSCAYIRHYTTKTIGEWVRSKMKRGFPDQTDERMKENLTLEKFFQWNKKTEEKIEYAQRLMHIK